MAGQLRSRGPAAHSPIRALIRLSVVIIAGRGAGTGNGSHASRLYIDIPLIIRAVSSLG